MYLQLQDAERTAFVGLLIPLISMAKKSSLTRQIAALERVIFGPGRGTGLTERAAEQRATALSVDVNSADANSAAPTPSLTNGLNSPQSTSPTSVCVASVQNLCDDKGEPAGPEVRVQEM